jgi:hypothetical protein
MSIDERKVMNMKLKNINLAAFEKLQFIFFCVHSIKVHKRLIVYAMQRNTSSNDKDNLKDFSLDNQNL